MRITGVIFLVWLVGMIRAAASDHVTELWRTNFGTHNFAQYHLKAAELDANDNLVIAGTESQGYTNPKAFVKKLSSAGEVLWSYSGEADQFIGIDLSKMDGGGNIYFITWTNYTESRHLDYLKLSPQGDKLWHKQVDCMVGSNVSGAGHSLHVQADGTGYILGRNVHETGPGEFDSTMKVIKFSSDGELLWSTDLPGAHLAYGPTDMEKLMHVDATGNVLVTAYAFDPDDWDVREVFVLKLDPAGNIVWRTVFVADGVTSVMPGPNGICVGLSQGWALLGHDGTLLKKNLIYHGLIQVRAARDNGQFLLESLFDRQYVLINSDGTVAWTADTMAYQISVPLPDGNDGWQMVAHIDHNYAFAEYSLISLRSDGNQRWRQPLTPFSNQRQYNPYFPYKADYQFLRASDGTLRIVCQQRAYPYEAYGIGVVAYRLEDSDAGPDIISTPPPVVEWNGAEDLSLGYTASGEGPLSFQIRYSIPQEDSTIVLAKDSYPLTRGFYRWDVIDANGRRAATRNTLVKVNQLRLYPQASSMKLTVLSDYFTRLRVEYSTNLVDWLPWPRGESVLGNEIDIPNSTTNYFFRALRVE